MSRRVLLIAGAAVVSGGIGVILATRGRRQLNATAQNPQADAPPPTGVERRTLVVAGPGDIRGALASAGVLADEAGSVTRLAIGGLAPGAGDLTLVMMIKPIGRGAALVSLEARYPDGSGVMVRRAPDGRFSAQAAAADLRTTIKVVRGEMNADSFYASALNNHLSDVLISPFAQALAFDLDFQREVHAGDIFEAAFEDRVNGRGESVGAGRLLYVSMETKDKALAFYWFQTANGQAGWFDGNGRSTIRSLMRTPVEGARISSTFGMREHPILGFTKQHNGVDFAAPVGTPIYAAGDGLVTHAEMKALDGNYVEIQHDNGWQTLYLHMSAFGAGISPGVRVRQGQRIGSIGTTGRSTGPHLHYEVHVQNLPVDPMSLKLDAGPVLSGAVLKRFLADRDRIDALRAAQTQ